MCDLPLKAASICPSSVCWEGLEATDPQVMWNLTPGGQLPDTIVHSKESRIFRDTAGARRGQNEPGMWGTKWESTQSLSCHNNRGSQKTGGFLTVLEAGDPRSRCQQGWFLVRPVSVAYGRRGWFPVRPVSVANGRRGWFPVRPVSVAYRWWLFSVSSWLLLCVCTGRVTWHFFLFWWRHRFSWISALTLWPHLP